jgi:transcriptional regulator of acetoin/glycerol metabolism
MATARLPSSEVSPDLARPRHVLPPDEVGSRLKAGAPVITFAKRIITPVCCVGPQRRYIYILCDPELVALKIFAGPEVLVAAEEASVKPGTLFTEESCGTNALALAKEHQRLVAVRGEQHYCKLFKDWWCVAAPLKDPAGRTVGYLDISMHAEKELGLAAALLQTLVNSIERELYLRELEQKFQQTGVRLSLRLTLPPEVERELTRREQEVLELLLCRASNREIAERLFLSVATVKTHRRNIYQKLGVSDLRGLLARLGQ